MFLNKYKITIQNKSLLSSNTITINYQFLNKLTCSVNAKNINDVK